MNTVLLVAQLVLLMRFLNLAEYGIWASLSVVGSLSMIMAGFGTQVCNRLSSQEQRAGEASSEEADFLLAAFSLIVWLAAGVIFLLLLFGGFLPWKLLVNASDQRLFEIARTAFPLALLLQLAALPFTIGVFALRAGNDHLTIAFLTPLATASTVILLLLFHDRVPLPLLLLFPFVSWFCVYLGSFALMMKKRGWRLRLFAPSECIRLFGPHLKDSAYFAAYGYLFALLTVNLPFFMGLARGYHAAGRFDLYFRIFLVLLAALADMLQPLWPAYAAHISRNELGWVRRTLKVSLAASAALVLLLSAVIFLAAPRMVVLIAGRPVPIAKGSLLLLSAWLLVCVIAHGLQVVLTGSNIIRPQLLLTLMLVCAMAPLSLLTASCWGVLGPLAVNIVFICLLLALMIFLVRKRLTAVEAEPRVGSNEI